MKTSCLQAANFRDDDKDEDHGDGGNVKNNCDKDI